MFRDILTILENQMNKQAEHEKEAGVVWIRRV